MVESELLLGVQQRLGGICCPVGCEGMYPLLLCVEDES